MKNPSNQGTHITLADCTPSSSNLLDVNTIPKDINNPKIRPRPFIAHIFLNRPFFKNLSKTKIKSTQVTKNINA